MTTTINADSSNGFKVTADTSSILALQTNGTTAISIDASQAVTMAGRTSNPTTISVGAATPSTSGAGITFPATQSASTDANTLDDYEEGTWTPTDGSGAGLSFSVTPNANYVKIGRLVTVNFFLSYPSTASTAPNAIGGLPFNALGSQYTTGTIFTNAGVEVVIYFDTGSGFSMRTNTNTTPQNVTFSTKFVCVSLTYMSA